MAAYGENPMAAVKLEENPEREIGVAAAANEVDRCVQIDMISRCNHIRPHAVEAGSLKGLGAPLEHSHLAFRDVVLVRCREFFRH